LITAKSGVKIFWNNHFGIKYMKTRRYSCLYKSRMEKVSLLAQLTYMLCINTCHQAMLPLVS